MILFIKSFDIHKEKYKKFLNEKVKIKTPSLSVVIPVYNEAKTIEEIFDKVYENKLVSEIIIVDDFSSDKL